ncbi:hypothetical protein [Streptomyces sulphureus]|uniref:hypothetical protein n=1 Tax=Streptomyces sulphureus TaxID=47758 RepID=UPI00037A6E61|nr:hypothetical protein [Streptomyces sulphureus]
MTTTGTTPPDQRPHARRPSPPGARPGARDLYAVAAVAALVLAASLIGVEIQRHGQILYVDAPPLYAEWLPHVGPGTPAALLVAAAVVAYGPPLAARLGPRALPLAVWAASAAWCWSLALVDGWQRGVAGRLLQRHEYLLGTDRFDPLLPALRTFTDHILIDSVDHWPAHIAGHPPGAVLTFVGLDRMGLGGGAWAAVWCLTVGSSAAAAVLCTLRTLGGDVLARRAAPFLVLTPAAVWIGVSADGYFAAVGAWALALLAGAATGTARKPRLTAAASGLLFGILCHLSYGLVLFALPALAVLLLARSARPLAPALAGVCAVALPFALCGFNWWEAYHLLTARYYQGVAATRPYAYWVWANLACTALATGPAAAAGVRRLLARTPRAVTRLRARRARGADRATLLVAALLAALLLADASGMSKGETERIWLPFMVWLPAACAALHRNRSWLAAQAALALLLNHLLLTGW